MQSHLVKLDPPYQIIHYGGVVGIQIGTLIVVGNQYPGDTGIENIYTHSHPVVSYVDKQLLKTKLGKDRGNRELASYYGGGEGNVWSKVEVSDVDIIGLTDLSAEEEPTYFEWGDFVLLVSDGFSLRDAQMGSWRESGIFDLVGYLRRVGLTLKLPEEAAHLELNIALLEENEHGFIRKCIVCQEENPELITFYAPFKETDKKTIEIIIQQLWQYLSLMRSLGATIVFKESEIPDLGDRPLQIAPEDKKRLSNIVKTLNDTYNEKYRMQQPSF